MVCAGLLVGAPLLGRAGAPTTSNLAKLHSAKLNLLGRFPIVMYHRFGKVDTKYIRNLSHFRRDLERLDKMGFRPVTVSQYLSGKLDIPPGSSPVILTFDDSESSQLAFDRKGQVRPNCAVGVWMEFSKKHPEFGVKGTFYVLPDTMWEQEKWRGAKVKLLQSLGSEIACHTWDHPNLRRLSDREVESELGRSLKFLNRYGVRHTSLAYPYGIYPRHRKILSGFTYNGKHYALTGAMTCNPDLAFAPGSPKLDRQQIPRIEAQPGFMGLDWWLRRLEEQRYRIYKQPGS